MAEMTLRSRRPSVSTLPSRTGRLKVDWSSPRILAQRDLRCQLAFGPSEEEGSMKSNSPESRSRSQL